MKSLISYGVILATLVTGSVLEAREARRMKPKAKAQFYYSDSNSEWTDGEGQEEQFVPDGVSSTSMRTRYRMKRRSDWQIVPTLSYLNTNWEGSFRSTNNGFGANNTSGTADAKSGFGAGVGVLFGRNQFQFETGLQYAQRSLTYQGPLLNQTGISTGQNGKIDVDMKYIEVPLMARFSFTNPLDNHVFLRGGVIMAMLQGSSRNLTQNYNFSMFNSFNTAASADGTLGEINSTDLRGTVGVGGEFKLSGAMSAILTADYQRSFTPVTNASNSSIVNTGFGLSAGLGIAL